MRRGSYDDAAASIRPHLQNLAQRRRSAPSLAFGRALGKTWIPIREEGFCQVAVEQCPFVLGLTNENAELALNESVQLTEGLKTRERHLFLFSDILVIAKLKASSSYRLKHKVSLEQLWLVTFEEEEDGDLGINLKTSLFMAWPLAHCVVSFRSPEVKERWLDTLHRKIKEATERSGSLSTPPSVLMTVLSGNITCKTITGGGMDSVIEQPSDGTAKPLPASEQLCNMDGRVCPPIENGSSGKWSLFQKKLRKSSSQTSPTPCTDPSSKTPLFGQQLSKVCDGNEKLPKPITEMLTLLLKKGTSTVGVFRKPGNARNLKDIREKLNGGEEVDMGDKPVTLLAALFKDFLRQLPGSLLVADQYKAWMAALEKEDDQEKCSELKQVIDKLPRANIVLLQHLLCVLHHISRNANTNKMDAKNLAVCIAPNLLQCDNLPLDRETVEKVTDLTQFLIENCCEIFGEHIQTLLGDPNEEELIDNSDSLSSHQHDSAYDSTDPDADGDMGDCTGNRDSVQSEPGEDRLNLPQCSLLSATCKDDQPVIPSCSSSAIFQTFTKPSKPFNRRCSEPIIFHTAGVASLLGAARSHEDFSLDREGFKEQPLKKQISDDSFLQSEKRKKGQAPLPRLMDTWATPLPATNKDDSCSSSCSLESSFSNQSENSVFTSSPLASPSSPRKPLFPHHQALSTKAGEEAPQQEREVKRRTQSMKNDNKAPRRVRSWGSFAFSKSSLKKGDPQKEALFPCETLPEDSQSEAEPADPPSRPRPLSAIVVFQQVDSRIPSKPPSYEEAILSGSHPAPPQYRSMTVQGARELERRSRPSSVSEELLYSCPVNTGMDCFTQIRDIPVEDTPVVAPHPVPFRQRAMSESVSRTRHEKLNRRCSQPLFEEISYAKESYV